jgi:DNA repair protein RecN (Recombination protein N)
MLLELRIKNFAIIESLQLEFSPGLVILTGETGAGKSIIMGALDMLLGHRVDMSTLRKGSDFASVEASFKIPENVRIPIEDILRQEDLYEDSEYLTLTRELRKDKRNTARVNGLRTNVAVLVELGEYLVDIHGQSEHLSLMRINQHLELLDRYSGTTGMVLAYQNVYEELKEIESELDQLKQSDLDSEQRKELLAYQIDEIEKAALKDGEVDPLIEIRNRLINAEKLADLSQQILILLDDSPGHQPAVMDLMGQIIDSVEELSKTDPSLHGFTQRTADINDGLFEIAKDLRTYLDNLEFDPAELEKVQDRLELIRSLKRKYGKNIQEVLEYQEKSKIELNAISTRSDQIQGLEQKKSNLHDQLYQHGISLTEARKNGANQLTKDLKSQLKDLKMSGARFEVDFKTSEDPQGLPTPSGKKLKYTRDGLEEVEFLIETNPGEGLKPLIKTASGGETARLMLALKNVLAKADHISTLVFDEIDQGIGGRTGAVVGEKLYRLTPEHQVICITHLPQLAGFGQQHFIVTKSISEGRTTISVQEVSGESRVVELATMLGGATEKNMDSARDLLEYVNQAIN